MGECRNLIVADLTHRTNGDHPVPCSKAHTAQTFAVGTLPASTGTDYDSPKHGKLVYARCQKAFASHLGADESLVLRTRLSWAWFGASEKAFAKGARWYRCDVVGGPSDATELHPLPARTRGMLGTVPPPDAWLSCARGKAFAGSAKVACDAAHDWRAVTAVKVGAPDEPWPGEKIVRARSRDRCSDWVGAWLHYSANYEFGYTWFHQAEWSAGNRRSVCWAHTRH